MEKFIFKAKNWKGRTIKGVVEAQGKKQAINLLKERDLVIFFLRSLKKTPLDYLRSLLLMRVSLSQVVGFTRQLATMVAAGLPLSEALELLEKQSKGRIKEVVEEALAKVQGGEPLAQALEKERKVFGDVYIASIRAGEEGGVLDQVLLRLADNLENKKEFLGKVKGAMIYPVIVVIGMVAVTLIMMVLVVPKMTSLYGEFETEMPLATKILISLASLISKNVWVLFILVIAGFFGLRLVNKTGAGKRKLDELKLKMPVIGPLLKAMTLTEISRTLGILLGTGVSLVDALKIVSDASGNVLFAQALNQAAERVEKGLPLSRSISENPIFPPIVAQLVATGEETGKLDEILGNVSKYFQTESEQKVRTLTSAIEPLIMILLGLGVGFLVFAIIMPIYNLTSQF